MKTFHYTVMVCKIQLQASVKPLINNRTVTDKEDLFNRVDRSLNFYLVNNYYKQIEQN